MMRKWRSRETEWLVQGNRCSKWQNWDLNPCFHCEITGWLRELLPQSLEVIITLHLLWSNRCSPTSSSHNLIHSKFITFCSLFFFNKYKYEVWWDVLTSQPKVLLKDWVACMFPPSEQLCSQHLKLKCHTSNDFDWGEIMFLVAEVITSTQLLDCTLSKQGILY